MAWSIAEVARMSGVTARALRHYDAIGLLAPAYIGANGYRYYEDEQLLRLQQILLLREFGLGLGEIALAICSAPDTVAALRRQHARLVAEQNRMSTLAQTVARTIAQLEGGDPMSQPQINRPENLFEGFDPAAYEAEARERWPEQYARAAEVAAAMSPEEMEASQQEVTANMIRMAELMAAGKAPGDPDVQAQVDEHYRWVSRAWTPSAEAYRNLGRMYSGDERFRANYEKITVGLAEFQRDAMAIYAQQRLGA
jgi:MerR family transcriptional regulator, thiopeptide resistance regulator